MAACLTDLPTNFGEPLMPKESLLWQRIQARRYANESYIHSVRLTFG